MRRKFSKGRFDSGTSEAIGGGNNMDDPIGALVNLSDIMLVFACGLMVALIINWNVDVAETAKGSGGDIDNKSEIQELEGGADAEIDDEADYVEYGVVYRDPVSGRFYMVPK